MHGASYLFDCRAEPVQVFSQPRNEVHKPLVLTACDLAGVPVALGFWGPGLGS